MYSKIKQMPREKTKYKLRCGEVACGNVVRMDKWTEHCRKHHAFKFIRWVDYSRRLLIENSFV